MCSSDLESIEDFHARIDDPQLDVDENSVLILRGCGPMGYPGMPEVSNMAILAKYIHRIDPMIPFLAGDRFNSESVISALFKEVPKIRIYFASFWEDQSQNEFFKKFKESYLAQWPGSKPSFEAGMTFDSLLVVAQAVRLSGQPFSLDKEIGRAHV